MSINASAIHNSTGWRDLALERADMARSMTRMAVFLFLVALIVSGAAVIAQSRYSSVCRSIDGEQSQIRNLSDRELDFARRLHRKHCD